MKSTRLKAGVLTLHMEIKGRGWEVKQIRPLIEAEYETLRAAWKDGLNGRVRQRVQVVYLAHRGMDVLPYRPSLRSGWTRSAPS